MKDELSEHWNKKYSEADIKKLGWYQKKSEPSLSLIQSCKVTSNAKILDVGSGSSTLIDDLLELDYTHIIATDISKKGLDITQNRLGKKAENVTFVIDDLTRSDKVKKLKNISIWHDRATLHFFTDKKDQNAYLVLLNGLSKCSGLSVKQYSAQTLGEFLGPTFTLIKSLTHNYSTTWGEERPFVYALFQKINKEN
jgi:EEF1A lysine methyltransferase 2